MGSIVVYKKPTRKQLVQDTETINKWFEEHPRRRVCHTDMFGHTKVRRGKVLEDLYAACDYSLPKKK